MSGFEGSVLWQGNREFGAEDIAYIRMLIQRFPRLPRSELADTLCRDLKLMQQVVKDQSSPAPHSPHAYVYTLLATINELTGWIVAGDRRWCEMLVGVLDATANELCFLAVTPMVKQTVLCLCTNLKKVQPLPKTVADSLHKVKRQIYRKRIRVQSAV
jgi:hypothetical protein